MRTYNKKAREYDRAIARKSLICSTFFERSPVASSSQIKRIAVSGSEKLHNGVVAVD